MPQTAQAASSKWFETDGARIRLIALPSQDPNRLDAALQVELAKGWKTYWRAPGASGLPPQLSFAASSNVVSTKIDYPVPVTFGEGKNLTAGYTQSVTFPIAVETLYPDRPVVLNVSGVLGICSEICVPVPFETSLEAHNQGGSSSDVAAALFQSRLNLVEQELPDFKIRSAKLQGKQVHISASVPTDATAPVLLVEGPWDWYLTPVRSSRTENGAAEFEIDLSNIPGDAKPLETELRLTLVSGGRGVERRIVPETE